MIDQLNKIVKSKTLNDITINSGRYSRKSPDGFNDFTKNIPAKLIGDKSLSSRPMGRIIDPLVNMGINISCNNS